MAINPYQPNPDDPDARDLPAGARLPDARKFRLDQLKARLVVASIGLALLLMFLLIVPEYRLMIGVCTGLVAIAVLSLVIRLAKAKRADSSGDQ